MSNPYDYLFCALTIADTSTMAATLEYMEPFMKRMTMDVAKIPDLGDSMDDIGTTNARIADTACGRRPPREN